MSRSRTWDKKRQQALHLLASLTLFLSIYVCRLVIGMTFFFLFADFRHSISIDPSPRTFLVQCPQIHTWIADEIRLNLNLDIIVLVLN